MPLADGVAVGNSGNTLLEGLLGSARWDSPGATTQIEIYIASNQTVVFTEDGVSNNANALAPLAAETAAINQMLAIYETFLNIDFTITNTLADADIYVAFVAGTDPTIAAVPGTLGIAMMPETTANFQGGVLINRDAYQSGTAGLVQGGYDFITLMHEFGHALGLAHPHDTGGGSTVFPGVTPGQDTGDLGDFNLNQGVYTMMSYNDGWQTAPQGALDFNTVFTRGFEGTPMALDIAALQFMYGVNSTRNAGNTVYTLANVNAVGSFYSAIWDTGGIDEIRNTSNIASTIDLRSATLTVANGGGGFVSNVTGIDGGFTIANLVVIENASGGGGADSITGNSANNVLLGNGGVDTLNGNAGTDTLDGGIGADIMRGGADADLYIVDNAGDVVDESVAGSTGLDVVRSSISFSLADAVHAKGSIENLTLLGTANLNALGNALANLITGNTGANTLNGGGGADTLRGGAGNDTYTVDNVADLVDESIAGSNGLDTIRTIVSFNMVSVTQAKGAIENIVLLGAANLNVIGNTLGNVITGNAGINLINGGFGNDTLTGGGGNDNFLFNTALNAATNVDLITDMNVSGNDTIRLENAIFTTLAAGALAATAFFIGGAAADASDRIIYNDSTGELFYDSNGNTAGGSTLFALLDVGLMLTAADFFVI